jgi:small subunit ribosomal protein S1
MNQSELGKTEEEINASSAGLSESETGPAPDAEEASPVEQAAANADAPTELESPVSSVDEQAAEEADVSNTADTATEDAPETGDDSSDDADSTSADAESAEDAHGLQRGTLVPGKIARTTPTAVYVTLENGVEGIVPGSELEVMGKKILDDLKPGLELLVYVVNPRNQKGKTILSINHALEESDWVQAEEYRQSKQVYDGKIGGYNKGGLIVRFGRLRGFVPQSQIAEERLRDMTGETPEERYGRLVGQTISVKVMEVDRSRNRLILSERAAMREVRQRRKETLIHELQIGEVREGTVVSLENFGAFVDVGGAEGLIHLTEITWRHITHPRQALNKGQRVRVKVISIDPDANRIGLSIKQLLPDPWDEIALEYGNGALVKGTITKLTKFGAFARIDTAEEPIEGLIHISELSDERVEHPKEVVNKGDVLTLRVVKVDVKNRRLGLSLKKVHSAEFLDQDMERAFRDAEREAPLTEAEMAPSQPVDLAAPVEDESFAAADVAEPVDLPAAEASEHAEGDHPTEAEVVAEEIHEDEVHEEEEAHADEEAEADGDDDSSDEIEVGDEDESSDEIIIQDEPPAE